MTERAHRAKALHLDERGEVSDIVVPSVGATLAFVTVAVAALIHAEHVTDFRKRFGDHSIRASEKTRRMKNYDRRTAPAPIQVVKLHIVGIEEAASWLE